MIRQQLRNVARKVREATRKVRKEARKAVDFPAVDRSARIGAAVMQLPEFNAALLDLSQRQLASDAEKDNLVKSVPIALRKITRDLNEVRGQLGRESNAVEQWLNETRGQLEGVSNAVDQRLGDISRQLERVSDSVGYLLGRVEFVRRELMFEMRYGATRSTTDADQIKAKVEIVNPQKLEASRSQRLRLNLGCGHIALEDYLNVDRRALPGIDVVAEVDELPFEPGEVDEIFSAHLLEHFPQEQLRRELLPYWIGLLKPGGVFRSVVPDAESMIKGYADGSYPYASLREVTFGGQDYDGDFHFNMFVADQIEELLLEVGLSDVEWIAKGRKNGGCFEMEFRALKK